MPIVQMNKPPAFPRMSQDEATQRVVELSGLPLDEVSKRARTAVTNATFYQTATDRITSDDLVRLRLSIRKLAEKHGFPQPQARGRSLHFDQQLSMLLAKDLDILPADAADEGVWSFLTLNVCPDVALWRFPNDPNLDGEIRENYERLTGKPRNVFRRAWWRAYILGPELSSQLIEDEAVGIMERPSIGGNPRLARAVAATHLAGVAARPDLGRQDVLREAIKRLRRRMGQISIHALDDGQLSAIVADAFQFTAETLHPESITPARSAEVEKFKSLIPKSWIGLQTFATEVPWSRMSRLLDMLSSHRVMGGENREQAQRIAEDLQRLVLGWDSYSSEGRSVVHASVVYFLEMDDHVPDHLPNGLDDDDDVVAAAYEALNLIRD